MSNLTTTIKIVGINHVSPMVAKVHAQFVGLSNTVDQVSKRAARAGKRMQMGGMMPTAMITYPAIRGFKSIISAQKDLEQQMNTFSRRSGTTQIKELEKIQKQAEKVAAITKYSTAEVIKAQTELSAAGLTNAELRAITPTIIRGSIAADQDPGRFADESTNLVTSFYGVTKGAAQWQERTTAISEKLALISASSNTTYTEASSALKNFGPIAAQLGLSLDTAGDLIGALANVGFKGAEAGRAMRSGFLRSVMMSGKAMRMLRQEGINFTDWIDIDPEKATAERFLKSLEPIAPGVKKHMDVINNYVNSGGENMAANWSQFVTDLNNRLGLKGDDATKMENRIAETLMTSTSKLDVEGLLEATKDASAQTKKELFSLFHAGKFGALGKEGDAGIRAIQEEQKRRREQILNTINPQTGKNFKTVIAFQAAMDMKGLPAALLIIQNAIDLFKRKIFSVFDYMDKQGNRQNKITDMINNTSQAINSLTKNMSKGGAQLAIFGTAFAAIGGPALILLGLAAQGFATLLRPLALLAAPLKFFAGRLGTAAVAGATLRGIIMRLGIVGAAFAAAWYGVRGIVDGFNSAIANSPAASEKASQAMAALKAVMRNLGDAKYGDAFSWLVISAKRAAATIKPTIVSALESIGTVDIDFGDKFDNLYKSITKLTGAFAPFGDAWKQFQKDIGGEKGMGTDQKIWDGIKNIGEGGLALTIDVITSALDTMATAINGVGEASKSAAKGDFTGFLDKIIQIVPDVIKEIAKLGPAMVESVGLKGKVETGTWEEWGNRVSRIINKVVRLLEKVGRKIASILPKSWREKMGIAAPHAKAVSEFQDNVIPMIRPLKLSTMPPVAVAAFAANDNRVNSLNGDTIAGVKGQVEAANIVKAAAELAAKKAEETASAVKSQTSVLERQNGLIAAGNADIVSAIHSNFSSAGHWQGNPASEAPGAPDAPIPISSNGGAGIHP